MSELEKKKKRKLIVFAVIVALIAGLIALIVFLLTYEKETHIIETYDSGEISSLTCSTTETSESAFFQNNAKSAKHELRMVYNNSVISKMSYEFRGVYDSQDAARSDDGSLHAKYNNYMGEHGILNSVLTPIFQSLDGELKISLYLGEYDKMNSAFAPLFYIGNGLIDTIGKNSVQETKKYYENKGFSCIIGD